jgi:protein ImuA
MSVGTGACADAVGLLDGESRSLVALRAAIRRLEGWSPTLEAGAGRLAFGVGPLDEALGGGLPCAALHEIAARREAEVAAATGFALALAGRRHGAVLWIAEDMARLESGAPYGPGLDEVGLAPEAVTLVRAARPGEVLWAMEEALRCPAVGAVIGELRRPGAIDAVASRRLSLAAGSRQALALLLRAMPDERPLAAATRWRIGAARAAPRAFGPGPPTFAVELTRNRYGHPGSWMLEWNRAEQRFDLASAHPEPVAGASLDRPRAAASAA